MTYDLLIKDGHVFDPGLSIDSHLDIAIEAGRIAAIDKDIPETQAKRTVSAKGQNRYVVPGLIDIHSHVAYGATTLGVGVYQNCDPDEIGVRAGVTTVVDAGSTGIATVGLFSKYIQPRSKTRILPYANVGSSPYLLPRQSDISRIEDVDPKGIASCIEANPGLIRGFKLRLIGPFARENSIELIRLSKEITREHHLPLMVHIGDPQADHDKALFATKFLLDNLDPGDILTHLFTYHNGGVMLDEERTVVAPELKEAQARGITLDPAPGAHLFGYDLARKQAEAGLYPDTISSDLSVRNHSDGCFSLLHTMARFMAIGYRIEDVIRMSTINAAKAIGEEDNIGSLAVGREADITVLDFAKGRWQFYDGLGKGFTGETAFEPIMTFRAGELIEPQKGPHPWGWLPPEA